MGLSERQALGREVPPQMHVYSLSPIHGRINGYQDYPAHLPSPYLLHSNNFQLNSHQPNSHQLNQPLHPNTLQLEPLQLNSHQRNLHQSNTLQQNPFRQNLRPNVLQARSLQPTHFQQNHCQPNPHQPKSRQPKSRQPKSRQPKSRLPKSRQPKSRQPKSRQPKSRQPKSRQPKSRQPNLHQLNPYQSCPAELPSPYIFKGKNRIGFSSLSLSNSSSKSSRHTAQETNSPATADRGSISAPSYKHIRYNKCLSQEEPPKKRARLSLSNSPSKSARHTAQETSSPTTTDQGSISATSSKHTRYNKCLSSQEEPPKKRARFEMTVNMETFLYDDIIFSALSFLSIEHISSAMRVSQTFAKIAKKVLRNTTCLVINCMANCDDYFKTILGNCRKVKFLKLQKSLLSKAQIYAILEHFAGTLVGLDMLELKMVCFKTKRYGRPRYPIACWDYFLTFVADTFKNLRFFFWGGCFQVDDFLYFARNYQSLEECGLLLVGTKHGVKMDTALEGLKMMLLRNQQLKFLSVATFVGAGELFLKLPKCMHLKRFELLDCKVSPHTKKALEEKYTNLSYFNIQDGIKNNYI